MDRPRVIIHNLISLDGRLVGFPADAGLSGGPDAVALDLTAVERLRQGHVWVRYDVRKRPDLGLSRVDPAAKSGFPRGLADGLRLFTPPRRPPY